MFRQVLSKTPLTDDIANDIFTNITGSPYQGDMSFVATLRALVAPRMEENDTIHLLFASNGYTKEQIQKNNISVLLESSGVDLNYLHSGDVVICPLNRGSEESSAFIQKVKNELTDRYHGWKLIDKVEAFFRKVFSTVCFVKPENKNVIIFADNLNIRNYHYLQCGILAFMPWYFDPKKGVSEQEMELITSLREKTSDKYEQCIAKIAERYNFREARIKKLLTGFETKYEEAELKRVESKIERIIGEIIDYNNAIGECLQNKQENEIRMMGLQKKIAEGSENPEIMEYFLCNKNLILESVTNTKMTFSTIGYVTYYDEDEAESVIDNPDSYIYKPNGRGCNNIILAKDMEILMKAIFLEKTLKMRLCSSYTFDIRGNVIANAAHKYNSVEFKDCTPNTHIDRYSCMGDYRRMINELLVEHNYIGAIEQCMASTVSLNFSDSCVMEEFMRRLYGISDYSVNIRCIELPDGRVVEPKEAIQYLKSQNAQECEENG